LAIAVPPILSYPTRRSSDLAQYIADMRRVQPKGPYHLGGYCFGGNVAFEMARQLSSQNEQVDLLALINCAPPNSRYGRPTWTPRSEEHTSELQSRGHIVCRL